MDAEGARQSLAILQTVRPGASACRLFEKLVEDTNRVFLRRTLWAAVLDLAAALDREGMLLAADVAQLLKVYFKFDSGFLSILDRD